MRISSAAASRSARYQNGLMLSASTSTPVLSIWARRSPTLDHSRPGASSGWLITFAASGTMQCACTSTVLTRLPLTTTSRRPCAWAWPAPPPAPALAPAPLSQPTKARRGLVCMVPLIGMSVPLVLLTVVMGGECSHTSAPVSSPKHVDALARVHVPWVGLVTVLDGCLGRAHYAIRGLPGATEPKDPRSRPVCWTRRLHVRPARLPEVLGIGPAIQWQPNRVAQCLTWFFRGAASGLFIGFGQALPVPRAGAVGSAGVSVSGAGPRRANASRS